MNLDENIVNKFVNKNINNLQDVLNKIDAGETTTENYMTAFSIYSEMEPQKEYKAQIEKFAQLTMQSALSDINTNKNLLDAYLAMALVHEYKKQYNEEIVCYSKALEIEPDSAELYFFRGRLYNKLRKKELANKDYAMAVKIDPQMSELVQLLGYCDNVIIKTDSFIKSIDIYSFVFATVAIVCLLGFLLFAVFVR